MRHSLTRSKTYLYLYVYFINGQQYTRWWYYYYYYYSGMCGSAFRLFFYSVNLSLYNGVILDSRRSVQSLHRCWGYCVQNTQTTTNTVPTRTCSISVFHTCEKDAWRWRAWRENEGKNINKCTKCNFVRPFQYLSLSYSYWSWSTC